MLRNRVLLRIDAGFEANRKETSETTGYLVDGICRRFDSTIADLLALACHDRLEPDKIGYPLGVRRPTTRRVGSIPNFKNSQ